ncbi:choline dehydrogenase 6 [Nowakowskiella sp. JEL0078]|nr:choline dehydrogenase 6 [Nowakowskiella sp. JEL0078]
MTFGVETQAGSMRDWTRFKELARIDKSDEILDEHYLKLITMCAKVIDKTEKAAKSEDFLSGEIAEDAAEVEGEEGSSKLVAPTQIKVEMDGDVMTFDKAQMMVKRIDQMRRLREEILVHPELDTKITYVKSNRWMPSWWNAYYDKCFLQGIARWGIVHNELMLTDPELPFKELYDEFLLKQETEGSTKDGEEADRFWMSDQVARSRFKALDEVVTSEEVQHRRKPKKRTRAPDDDDDESDELEYDNFDNEDEIMKAKKQKKSKKSKSTKPFPAEIPLLEGQDLSEGELAKIIKKMKKKKKKDREIDDEEGKEPKKPKHEHTVQEVLFIDQIANLGNNGQKIQPEANQLQLMIGE